MRASGSRSRCARLPIPRQQFVNALGRVIRQAGQDFGKPSLWIDVIELGGGDEPVDGSRTPAVLTEPAKVQFLLPTATVRNSRSAALFDMHRPPSTRKRVKASQR